MMDKKSTACFYTLCFALTLISNNVLALGDSWQNTGTEFLTAFVQNFEDWLEVLASISCPVMTTAAIPAPTSISQMVTEKTAESTAPASTSQVATTEFITTRKPPGMIENLTVSNVNDTSFELSWHYPDGDTHLYEIQIDGPQQKAQVSTTESAEIQDLTPGTNYTVRVAAIAFNGRKGPFAEVSHFTNPGRVENISVSNVTTKSIELNWVHPEGNLSSYEIQIEGPQPKVLMADTESAILTDLTSATRYTFNIAAVGGDGTKGDVIEISTFTKPDKIQSISVNNVTTTSAMLTWERPYGDVKSYEIAIQGPESKVITVTTKFANITGLTPGTNYTYKVSPVTEDGTKGEFTAVNKFTVPGTIGSITASNVTMTSLVLSWKHPSGNLKAYEVQIVEIQADIQTTSETVTITKLDPGTTYTVKVAAVADDDTKGAYTITFQPTKKAPPNWCWSRRKPFCCLQPNVKCRSEDNSCFCDSVCPKYSNCCTDYKQHCLDKQY
ncbi:receptor-type tyrosine-protein phosphatase eta-like isoform X2 [Protopterus annectens]|uniref:receptor-type tyrosine-protein phosphatase eta-like isoform X2 n=1 Tax=Protopterus annectens TaxID=7888 RepID=UPI001CF93EB6|nr:receptor-type tyrosine-protein phosphatase eta-like isoform X2 [Protopterus annectens]